MDAGNAPFAVAVHGPPDSPVLTVHGEIDVATAPQLRAGLDHLIDAGAATIVVDLAGVSFLDSSGLGVLLGAHKRLHDEGAGALQLTGTQDPVRRVLEITGLSDTFLGGHADAHPHDGARD